jgi:hypothetical protein
MKKTIQVGFLILLVLGCAQKQVEELTPREKEQFKREVKLVLDSVISKWRELDADGGLAYYADSPDWAWIGPSGARVDFQAFRNLWKQVNQSVASIRLSTSSELVTVLGKDAAICAWEGNDETILKSGDKILYDPHAITFVLKRIEGQWKVTYTHESGIPVRGKAGMR